MAYKIVLTETAIKEAQKHLGQKERDRLKKFLKGISENHRSQGDPMKGRFKGQWRYKMGKIRILCYIDDAKSELIVLRTRWRKGAYRK